HAPDAPHIRHWSITLICMFTIFALFLPVLFVPLTTHAATAGNGRIYGQVLDGSKNNTSLVGQSVTLQMAQNGTAQDLKSVKTDGQGNFSFASLATGKGINYSVYLLYQGAQYNTNLIDLSTKAVQKDNLTVYDATTSTKKIAVLSNSILLQTPDAQKGIVTVSELYVFNNLDNHTYVGSLNAGSGMPDALRFSLPHTARNVSLSTGFDGYQSVQVDSGFASSAAVPPGISQFTFTFDMPYSQSSYDFDYLVVYPTVQLSLYVPTELHAGSDTLASQGIVTADQRPYQLLRATTLIAGKEVHAQLEGLPTVLPNVGSSSSSNTNTPWLVAALIVMALIILLTWSIYRSRHRVVPAATAKSNGKTQVQSVQSVKSAPVVTEKTEEETSERQKQLLQALLDLDTAYEASKLSKSVYQERRAKTKAKLRSLMASENANGSETAKKTASSSNKGNA
ncbi:MAG: carboxypeptidase-like regulatory domain-containing protein, partial [Ktedonobacteraceae bacterium]